MSLSPSEREGCSVTRRKPIWGAGCRQGGTQLPQAGCGGPVLILPLWMAALWGPLVSPC